jgi:hypothetical protein
MPAASWLLALLALKLTRTRRVCHVDDLLADPAVGLLAGLAVLPKKSALTSYSCRLSQAGPRSSRRILRRRGSRRRTCGSAAFPRRLAWRRSHRWTGPGGVAR